MNILQQINIKTLVSSFFLMTTFIFTGCGDKNNSTIDDEYPSINEEIELLAPDAAVTGQIILLPKGYENEVNINERMADLSDEELNSYAENYRVFNFLESIKKAEGIYETLNYGQLYTDTDMSKHLVDKEIEDLKKHIAKIDNVARDNWYWGYISCWAGGSFKLYRQYYFTPPPHWGTHYWYSQYSC